LGALSALESQGQISSAEADLILGTSAGSVIGALLRAGNSVEQLCAAQLDDSATAVAMQLAGTPAPGLLLDFAGEPCWPGLPRLGVGSWPLAMRALRRPWRLAPGAVCSALLPRGRRRLTTVGRLIENAFQGKAWPAGTWMVAMNYHTGAPTAFGRAGSPNTSIARAVMASCAVPGWFESVPIHRVPYIDGAVCSPCNVDLVAAEGLNEVYVLAPMASLAFDRPRDPLTLLERLWRRAATRRTMSEVARLRASGTRVRLITPNARDLEAMGANMMDNARRAIVLRSARESVGSALTERGSRAHHIDLAA
jgi:NTE family protein